MLESNTKYSFLNNGPKTKWDGAENPRLIVSMKLVTGILNILLKVNCIVAEPSMSDTRLAILHRGGYRILEKGGPTICN